MDEETIKQIKSIVREAVSEIIDAKMAVWQLQKEYEQCLQMEAMQAGMERLRVSAEVKREIMEATI